MIIPISKQDFQDNFVNSTKEFFKDHQLLDKTANSWYIGRKNSSVYAAEICSLRFGHIVVHGDIPDVIFRGGPKDPLERLHWLANSNFDYAAQKALLWKKTQWEPDVALFDVYQAARDSYIDEEDKDELVSLIKTGHGQHEVQDYFYSNKKDFDYEYAYSIGDVIHTDILICCLAAQTAVKLLEKENL